MKRVQGELENVGSQGKIQTSAKIIAYAKGPFGIITLAAVLISGLILYQTKNNLKKVIPLTPVISEKPKIKAIEFQGKKIALTEIIVGTGSDCDSPHYHANDHISVKALDGSVVRDPGGCGLGRVKDVSVIEIN